MNMKKQYIKPTTDIYMMELEQMIAESYTFDDTEGTGKMGLFSDQSATGPALSKGHTFDVWGDDEY